MSPLIEVHNLTKSYFLESQELSVLKGVNLTLFAGECLFILGASGSGKSTLLHLLGSLDVPSSGTILYEGEGLFQRGEEALARFRNQKIGFVFQFHYLLGDFTALENVMMPLLIRGEKRNQASLKASQVLDQLGLGGRKGHRPSELSGGEQQRVAVARALVTEPCLLLADEPTGNLDTETGLKLIDLLLEAHLQKKVTLVIVTHNEDLIQRAKGRTTVRSLRLKDGTLQAC
ncbi:MAG: ABC transporter ATP-binding protein [Deltaproteobacteria bacterium]|nr:ABC transporter ATP-binding protein [Deltaproteobacteria bacterium]